MARLLNHGGPVSVAGRRLDGRRGHKPKEGSIPDSLLSHPVVAGLISSGRLEVLDSKEDHPDNSGQKEQPEKGKKKRGRPKGSKSKSKKEEPAKSAHPEPEFKTDLEPMDPAEE